MDYDAENYKDLDKLLAMREEAKNELQRVGIDALIALELKETVRTLDIAIARVRDGRRQAPP